VLACAIRLFLNVREFVEFQQDRPVKLANRNRMTLGRSPSKQGLHHGRSFSIFAIHQAIVLQLVAKLGCKLESVMPFDRFKRSGPCFPEISRSRETSVSGSMRLSRLNRADSRITSANSSNEGNFITHALRVKP